MVFPLTPEMTVHYVTIEARAVVKSGHRENPLGQSSFEKLSCDLGFWWQANRSIILSEGNYIAFEALK
jgi:hypothetical protein